MGPKKIKKPQENDKKEDSPPQKRVQQIKSDVKLQKITEKVNPPPLKKQPEVNSEPIKPKLPQNSQNISLNTQKLSQQEILRLRRQKFKASSVINESQQIKQQRLKKFGGQNYESKQQLQERKKKFLSSSQTPDDQLILKQRRQKFSNSAIGSDPADVLQQRKKKFSSNQQTLIDLDEEIKKSKAHTKPIKKGKKNKFGAHDASRKKGERFQRNKNKLGKKPMYRKQFKSDKKGVNRIKRNKNFIKRRPLNSRR